MEKKRMEKDGEENEENEEKDEEEEEEEEEEKEEEEEEKEEEEEEEEEEKEEEEEQDELEDKDEVLQSKFQTIDFGYKKHYNYLAQLLNFNSTEELKTKLHLLFRASEHDFSASAFHRCCDNKGPTITIIRSTNKCIFGGFASESWFSNGGFAEAPGSFLFSLNKETKHEIYQNENCAIEGNRNWGPIFSDDLYLPDICHVNYGHSSLGSTYTLPNSKSLYYLNCSTPTSLKMKVASKLNQGYFLDSLKLDFLVKEYEVYRYCE